MKTSSMARARINKMNKKASEKLSEKIALYDKLVATNPAIARKGASIPYTSLNGHMFSFITIEGKLALRLPKEDIDCARAQ